MSNDESTENVRTDDKAEVTKDSTPREQVEKKGTKAEDTKVETEGNKESTEQKSGKTDEPNVDDEGDKGKDEVNIEDKDEVINARQSDLVENYKLPEAEKKVDAVIPSELSLEANPLADEVVNKLREFRDITNVRPYVTIEAKFNVKYQTALLIPDLFNNPKAIKSALMHLTLEKEGLVLYALAMGQLARQATEARWRYDQELLIKLTTFLNLVTLYHYKITGVDSTETRPSRKVFKSYLFKSGVSKAVASTVAGMLY